MKIESFNTQDVGTNSTSSDNKREKRNEYVFNQGQGSIQSASIRSGQAGFRWQKKQAP